MPFNLSQCATWGNNWIVGWQMHDGMLACGNGQQMHLFRDLANHSQPHKTYEFLFEIRSWALQDQMNIIIHVKYPANIWMLMQAYEELSLLASLIPVLSCNVWFMFIVSWAELRHLPHCYNCLRNLFVFSIQRSTTAFNLANMWVLIGCGAPATIPLSPRGPCAPDEMVKWCCQASNIRKKVCYTMSKSKVVAARSGNSY